MTNTPQPDVHQPGCSPPEAAPGDAAADETLVTDVTIQPDGRVYVFGTSRPVLEVLETLNPDDPRLRHLLGHVRALETSGDHGAL